MQAEVRQLAASTGLAVACVQPTDSKGAAPGTRPATAPASLGHSGQFNAELYGAVEMGSLTEADAALTYQQARRQHAAAAAAVAARRKQHLRTMMRGALRVNIAGSDDEGSDGTAGLGSSAGPRKP
jgi:hypothetical protein